MTTTEATARSAMKLALEALEELTVTERTLVDIERGEKAITALREALTSVPDWASEAKEQPAPPPECKTEAEKTAYVFGWFKAMESVREQEPTNHLLQELDYAIVHGWPSESLARLVSIRNADNQQCTWVGLTDDEIMDMYNEPRSDAEMIAFGREVEAKLMEKNT
jgi:hypothetical protein